MLRARLLRPAVLALALLSPFSWAATPLTATTQATAAVAASCVIVTADNLVFGGYSPISGLDASSSGQLALRCTKGAAFSVSPTSGGTTLRGPGGMLTYGLYIDSALTQAWGAGGGGTVSFDLTQGYDGDSMPAPVFLTALTAEQFAANPALARQAYGVSNTDGTLRYYTGYFAQATTAAQAAALTQAHAGSTVLPITEFILTDGAQVPEPGEVDFVLPTATAHAGRVYQAPTAAGGAQALSGTARSSLAPEAVTYYGKVPAGQDLAAGSYTDTVVFTVSF